MPRYRDDSRDRVRDAVDMVDLVQTRTELKRAGPGRYSGRCCFHEERTPSLSVDAERKLYHCFGCQVGGDCFTFVQETEGTDFSGALEYLAGRYGVTLEIVDDDPRAAARRKQEQSLLALAERAAAFYERLLWTADEAKPARDYLLGRGLTEEALKTYRVGWAPAGWDRLVAASAKAGVEPRMLEEAGLAMRKRDGRGYNDRFHGRITFPLCDGRGQVRGFGARAMSAEQQPKYLNTSENRVFSKGRQLFGLHLARSAAAKSGVVVLVEGYTDVVALHQIGVGHVVALMGTAMTPEQLTELSRLAPLLVLALDPDGAGEAAMEKAAVLARGSRLELRVAELPDGRDPAELVQDGRAEELRAALEHHEHFVEFRVRRLIRGRPAGTAEERDAILHTAAPLLNVLPEGNLRNDLIALLSDKLGTGAALVEQLVRGSSRRGEVVATGTPAPQPMARGGAPVRLGALEEQERATLAIMLGMGSEGRAALERMEVDDWQVDRVRAAAEWLLLHGFATGELPADDALSAVIRDVMLRVDRVEPRPALLRFEVAQLDLRRLERRAKQGAIPSEDAQREGQVLRERLDLAMDALMQD